MLQRQRVSARESRVSRSKVLTMFPACCVLAQERSAAELAFALALLMLAKVRLFAQKQW